MSRKIFGIYIISMKIKNNIFMKNLKKFRKIKGISQDELANKTGISKRMISYYENKTINPPIDKIELIAKALDVTISDLLDEKNSEKNNDFVNIDSRITKRIIQIKKLPIREQNALWKYIDYVISQNNNNQKKSQEQPK